MKTNSKDLSKAVFLDRDGPIIPDTGYVRDHEKVQLSEGAVEGMRLLKEHGFKIIVISNQAGVAKKIITPEQAKRVHERVVILLRAEGVELDDVYYCFHHPDDRCECRKPKTKHVHDATAKHGIDVAKSFFAGDKPSDLQAGRNAHSTMKTVLVGEDLKDPVLEEELFDFKADNLKKAAEWIIRQE